MNAFLSCDTRFRPCQQIGEYPVIVVHWPPTGITTHVHPSILPSQVETLPVSTRSRESIASPTVCKETREMSNGDLTAAVQTGLRLTVLSLSDTTRMERHRIFRQSEEAGLRRRPHECAAFARTDHLVMWVWCAPTRPLAPRSHAPPNGPGQTAHRSDGSETRSARSSHLPYARD